MNSLNVGMVIARDSCHRSKRRPGVPPPVFLGKLGDPVFRHNSLWRIPMEKELLEMAAQWRTTAQEMIAKGDSGTPSIKFQTSAAAIERRLFISITPMTT